MQKHSLTFINTSQRTIKLLENRGMSQTDIADFLEVSKSFISRVKAGTRSFTLQHLAEIGEKFDQPLPLLLFRLMDPETIKPENRKLYSMVKRMIEPKTVKRRKKSKAA